jgi:putative acetyltransferase
VEIRVDDLSDERTRALLRLHLAGMHASSPPDHVFALDLSGLQAPDVTAWTVRIGDAVAGFGALKDLGDGTGEIKSMRTHPDFLRRGVAAALLEHIVTVARDRGLRRLSLETGSGPAFEAALALYRRRGFEDGAAFAQYVRSPFNQFLHLQLSEPTALETPMDLHRPALDPGTIEPNTSSGYPEPYRSRVLPREKRQLGKALGLRQFGVNLTTLPPGKESSMRHWHTHEEEFVYVLEGEVVLRTDAGEQVLAAGCCAGFPAGSGDGHQLVNRSDRPAVYLEVGTNDEADAVFYPDVDMHCDPAVHGGRFTRRDGSAY